jgi:hypothetical protein
MRGNRYHLQTHWRVRGNVREVFDVVSDGRRVTTWWPAAFLSAVVVDSGRPGGHDGVIEVITKGWLPYTIHWWLRVIESREPHGFSLEAWGDFNGRGTWDFKQDGPYVDVTFDWRITADRPLLRWFSLLLKPLFAANHRWAMARGEESLQLELIRRRTGTAAERAAVPAPPGPTWPRRSQPVPARDLLLEWAPVAVG